MSKVITITAAAGTKFTFENIWTADAAEENEALANLNRPLKDDDKFNTGLATIGDPHVDEIVNGQKWGEPNPALVKDLNGWKAQHVAAVPLYRTNEVVYLLPGDKLVITTDRADEAAHFASIHDPLLKVTSEAVTEGEEREVEAEGNVFLGRTTGIGDFDDGNAENGTYPFQFDTAASNEADDGKDDGDNP